MKSSWIKGAVLALSAIVVTACGDLAPTAPGDPAMRDPVSATGTVEPGNMSDQAQARLAQLFEATSADVMAIEGTVFADHDERVGKLVFGVRNANAAAGVRRSLIARGLSAADFDVIQSDEIVALATLRDRFRPTQAGIQIHFTQYVCTMGFNVDHAGGRSFITNSHCTGKQGGTEGTVYYQPVSSTSPEVIATEVDDPVYTKGGSCPKGKTCRRSDSSRALYSASTASIRGDILKTTGANNGSLTVAGVFSVTSQDDATTSFPIGLVLNKVGRTTGWSQGPVSRTCVNTNVQGSRVHQLCQTFVDAAVDGGDSGSPVFRITSGDNVQLVGILWGGGTGYYVMSPLAAIQAELGAVNAVK
jgi:hypothetical protein